MYFWLSVFNKIGVAEILDIKNDENNGVEKNQIIALLVKELFFLKMFLFLTLQY